MKLFVLSVVCILSVSLTGSAATTFDVASKAVATAIAVATIPAADGGAHTLQGEPTIAEAGSQTWIETHKCESVSVKSINPLVVEPNDVFLKSFNAVCVGRPESVQRFRASLKNTFPPFAREFDQMKIGPNTQIGLVVNYVESLLDSAN